MLMRYSLGLDFRFAGQECFVQLIWEWAELLVRSMNGSKDGLWCSFEGCFLMWGL